MAEGQYKIERYWLGGEGGLKSYNVTSKRAALGSINKLKNVALIAGQRLTNIRTGEVLWVSECWERSIVPLIARDNASRATVH